MGRLILISGGSGSGKSELAEKTAVNICGGSLYYIATMTVWDDEDRKRVERHRLQRDGKGFTTQERRLDIGGLKVNPRDCLLIECLSNLLANEMYDDNGSHTDCVSAVTQGITGLLGKGCDIVCVTNEVFSDGSEYDPSTLEYIQNLGEINRILALIADKVIEVVCGISITHKDGANARK